MSFKNLSRGVRQQLARPLLQATQANRAYFSLVDKVRDKFNKPWRHLQSFMEPDGMNHQAQLPEGYRTHGNTAASFSAYITQNAIELNQWHEMESVVHSQFGTVDNPVLIFTSDSSWRIVICTGPGVEDDSHAHEKMFYYVREGPIHRCSICGQCFKIVRLKDEFTEQQDYYSMMFSTLSHFDVAEEDSPVPLVSMFLDRPSPAIQTVPATNVYIHVNSDEADRILVDPAYKLERLQEAHEKLYAMHESFREVDRQLAKHRIYLPTPYGKDLYETWYNIEKAIRKFDRTFNKVEKFHARKFADPDNHERRESRMLDRKRQRWAENYTYFFGGLTEEEQMYRDYFETDLEADPEDDYAAEQLDERAIAAEGQFQFKKYDFIETSLQSEPHETMDDIVDQKIFKYKYRMCNDDVDTYERRQGRVIARFNERAKNRDASLETDLFELYQKDMKETSVAQFMLDPASFNAHAEGQTRVFREYMVKEALEQYRDYYESDAEEASFFQYLGNLSNRDKIRFSEIFTDFSEFKADLKDFMMIQKREHNPELSLFSNLVLDLVDFKDRVRPLARDIALMDVTRGYQKTNVKESEAQREELVRTLREIEQEVETQILEEGYSSREIEAPKKK